jgi:ferrous iron transport protein B
MKSNLRVALVGNPNTGKSTLFNLLTGLNQKIGNFPGVTVDKKSGFCKMPDGQTAEIIDLPGTYSLYPKSVDESIVLEVLSNRENPAFPDLIVIVADATNLKRNLLLYTQIADLRIPVIIALNMIDLAKKSNLEIRVDDLAKLLNVPVIALAARKNIGIVELKKAILHRPTIALQNPTIEVEHIAPDLIEDISRELNIDNPYIALQLAHQHQSLRYISKQQHQIIEDLKEKHAFHPQEAQAKETISRYNFINDVLADTSVIK